MDFIFRCLATSAVSRAAVLVVVFLVYMASGTGASRRYRDPGSPATLKIRPPPMMHDPVSPECYNFTIGNWRRQEFYTPNYPGEYINNTDCVLYLEAPPGFRIKLDFRDQFTLEKSEDCKYDFLEVRDGPFAYSPLINRFCGAMFPPLIESTNRFLWLRFKTDDLLQYDGFRAIYSYHKDHTQNDGTSLSKVTSTVCRIPVKLDPNNPDGLLTSEEVPFGDVGDPNYPRSRPVDCTWEIFTDQGHAINMHTLKMTRGNNVHCDISYVALYQGTTLERDLRARLCGDDEPEVLSVTSPANRVFVRLYGNALRSKPELEMVYSMVKTGDSCVDGYFSCGEFCISPHMRCNGVPNCPDGLDEQGCPGDTDGGRFDPGGGGIVGGGGRGGSRGRGGKRFRTGSSNSGGGGSAGDLDDELGGDGLDYGEDEDDDGLKLPIPLHFMILIGGVLLTFIPLVICIVCRSRHARKKRQEEEKREQAKRNNLEMAGTPTSQSLPTHSLTRHGGDRDGGGGRGGGGGGGNVKGQIHPQGRYMTFAQVTPTSQQHHPDNPNRYSFNGTNLIVQEGPGGEMMTIPAEMTESGQYRRYLMEITPDDLMDDPGTHGMYTSTTTPTAIPATTNTTAPQGVVIGMTHIPSPTTTTTPTTIIPGSHPGETPGGGGGYGMKYPTGHQQQWPRGMMMEDPTLVYPYSSSLPRPTPFLGLSKPFQAESKYLKSMQALKVMDEEIMKETPTS